MSKFLFDIFFALLGGCLLGIAWAFPGEYPSAILAWPATLLLLQCVYSGRPYLTCYLYGLAFHPLGFYWLFHTISHFGGFHTLPALLIFALFITLSSVQFLLFPFFFSLLPAMLRKYLLAAPIAWMLSEFFALKIFPWHLGHTQLAMTPFIQIADLGGSILISGAMIWLSAVILQYKNKPFLLKPATFILLLILSYGFYRIHVLEGTLKQAKKHLNVALVQANIPLHQKHDPHLSRTNIQNHLFLSKPYAQSGTLIIWPETAIMEWIRDDVGNVAGDSRLPAVLNGESWLIGALTYKDEKTFYNSSIAIFENGEVPRPYHKKILMPFGEYTPLGDYLPWLRDLNNTAGEFVAGTSVVPFQYPLPDGTIASVAALNCYEDIVTSMGIEAIQNGAEVLVNQTNDGWFGETVAPRQHHALAAFRSIETRRYLLRATNSGLTAVVDPLGRTTLKLPPFSSGVISTRIELLNILTPYAAYIGQKPYWLFTILICYTIVMKLRNFFQKGPQNEASSG